ncbi:leishmanolysin-like peptidase [Raphidocelis subcapitata]|uniref:Leishmanolysin-like peptidase n=1 Tax=Raphidocelis subcapitata TaxID=307507 RepID=A0A2V0PGI0_9CHLO|nr:leishmanolysin-like peptidase [Raphidocelis subcapitata]|eukprot:GBF98931.1 leishmanolysin-like peptidase [Raphidocelis subcapitata]
MAATRAGAALLALLAAAAALCALPAAAHSHDAACGHHHPDVEAASLRLLGQRLALLALREGPAAASAAAEAAARYAAAAPGGGAAAAERLRQLLAAQAAAGPAAEEALARLAAFAATGAGAPRRLAQSGPTSAPIRIKTEFQLSKAPDAAARLIRDSIVPTAVAALAKYVRVKRGGPAGPPAKPFNGRQSCLAEAPATPPNPEKDGYDLLLYVTADGSRCFDGMIAMSAACDVDPATGRPVIGSLNICPQSLPTTSRGQVLDSVVHEAVHVLGFSPSHYPDWRGADGQRYAQPVVYNGRAPFLATPKVAAEARRQFGCATAPGAPLETEGMGMSSLAHWEYRNTQHELMTAARPLDRQRAVMSRLTLAALEDSGWYDPDYSQAADLEWGQGAGCDFILSTCKDFADRNPGQDLYCPQGADNAARCSAGARLWGQCRSSGFTDGCLIVAREAPDAAGAGGAASDFSGNFICLPPAGGGGGGQSGAAAVLDAATQALLPRLGASGTAPDDRCFNLGAPGGGGGASTLCAAGGDCVGARAMCFRAACSGGKLSVEFQAGGGGAKTALECPTGTTLNLGAALTGRYASGQLQCPDNARTCRGLSCGACDPAGGFCSFATGQCSCWVERTGGGCSGKVA